MGVQWYFILPAIFMPFGAISGSIITNLFQNRRDGNRLTWDMTQRHVDRIEKRNTELELKQDQHEKEMTILREENLMLKMKIQTLENKVYQLELTIANFHPETR